MAYLYYASPELEWCMSPTLVSHNCLSKKEINTDWAHTSRFDIPLTCLRCGWIAPTEVEKLFRFVNAVWEQGKKRGLKK